jgi:dipeptidyl aminopeptidase/acylaminoacyl peptidase
LPKQIRFTLVLIALLVGGCRWVAPSPIASPSPILIQPALTTPGSTLLPTALYYLNNTVDGITRVFRLAQTSVEPSLRSAAPDGTSITDFDVSIISNRLAFIAANRLYLHSLDGTLPTLLFDGGAFDLTEDPNNRLNSPRWSPDGQTLAFAYNGIQLYLASSGTLLQLLPNQPVDSAQSFTGAIFAPYAWAPDGSRLLVSISLPNKTNLGVLSASTGALTLLPSEGVCCQATWTLDSLAILVSNLYPQTPPVGLWLHTLDQASSIDLFSSSGSIGAYHIVGWPYLTSVYTIHAFYSETPVLNLDQFPLSLVEINLESSPRVTVLRTDTFFPKEVLWAPDGTLAVAILPLPAETAWSPSGALVLIPANDQQIIPLAASGYNIHWGP